MLLHLPWGQTNTQADHRLLGKKAAGGEEIEHGERQTGTLHEPSAYRCTVVFLGGRIAKVGGRRVR